MNEDIRNPLVLACKARRLVIEADIELIRLLDMPVVKEISKEIVLLDTNLEALAGRITRVINHIERAHK